MVFRSSHAIGCWSQLRLTSLGGHGHKLTAANLERVAGSIGIALARLRVGSGWAGTSVTPLCRRMYANTAVSRPKAHTGRTTSAPKRKAATRSTTKSARQPQRKKAPQAKRRSRTAAKSRRKAPRARTKSRAKPKGRSRAKKPLSEATKIRLAKKKDFAAIRQLKERALSPPGPAHAVRNPWVVFLAEQREALRQAGDHAGTLAEFTKAMRARYKELSPAQLEHYNHVGNQNFVKRNVDYHKWLERYTPAQIRDANHARRALGRRGLKPSALIKDERQVTPPSNAYIFYVKARQSSGDFRGIPVSEASKLIGAEWRAAGPTDKKKYDDLRVQDMDRYVQEYKSVYGIDPKVVRKRKSTTTAAAPRASRASNASSASTVR